MESGMKWDSGRWRATVPFRAARERGWARAAAGLLAAAASAAVFTAACGGPTGPAGPSHPPGYGQYRAYSQCLRSHGAPFWPEPSEVPQGVWDNPNTYKITPRILADEHGPGWQAALTACQKLAPRELPYTAAQISVLRSHLQKLAGCMRAHGITGYPSPGALDGGLHEPDATAIGLDTHTPQFAAAARACGMAGGLWQAQWWWPAGLSQP
jgi:hypothetical protein